MLGSQSTVHTSLKVGSAEGLWRRVTAVCLNGRGRRSLEMRGLGEHAGLGLCVGLSHTLPKPRDTAALWFKLRPSGL